MQQDEKPESNSFLTARSGNGFTPRKVEYVDTKENISVLNPPPESSWGALKEDAATAASNSDESASETIVEPPASTNTPSVKVDVKKMTDLVKLERRLAKREADAKATLEKAERIADAFNDPDLVTAIQKLGLDPGDVYKKMTKFALDKLQDKPAALDPKEAELLEVKKQLSEYKAGQERIEKQLNDERAVAAHAKAMNERVVPVFKELGNQLQPLIKTYGSEANAIAAVYDECFKEYNKSGVVIDPKDAAIGMNKFYKEAYLESVKHLKEMDDFKDMFKTEEEKEIARTTSALELEATSFSKALAAKLDSTPSQQDSTVVKTLSNSNGSVSATKPPQSYSGKVDHLARFLAKKGLA